VLQIVIAVSLLALLVLVILRPDPATLRRYWRSLLLWGGLGLILLLVVAGRLHWLAAAAAAAYTLFRRLLPLITLVPSIRRLWGGGRNQDQSTDQGGDQSGQGRGPGSGTGARLSETEARAILGVDAKADRAAIIAAHRRLMQKMHPDRGGSDYLASRINAAKQRLLQD